MPSKLPMIKETDPWYKEGLPFKCTGCGQCCTGGPGAVWVSDEEIKAIADSLELCEIEFKEKFTHLIDGRLSLKEKPRNRNYDCIFLEQGKCTIYAHRPKQCRTFPFWPQIMKSKSSWQEASKWCEGINPAHPIVPYAEIQKQLD